MSAVSTQQLKTEFPKDRPRERYAPVRIVEIELEHPLPILSAFDEKRGCYYHSARCLVRLHRHPLGIVELIFHNEKLTPAEYAPEVWRALSHQVNEHLRSDDLPEIDVLDVNGVEYIRIPRCVEEREQFLLHPPFVSIVVPTHNRHEQLAACLRSLATVSYPHYEVIVVDNAPDTDATFHLVHEFSQAALNIHYIREDRAGPSWARNSGIRAAKGEIIAFIDDDVVVDAYWLAELVRTFRLDTNIACVTGLVLPLELETPAQLLFEQLGGFSKGCTRQIYTLAKEGLDPQLRRLHPYVPGRFGTGASMAFTAEFLRKTERFDPAMGGDGPSRCGQDIALFFQVIVEGHKLVYQPAALVYHLHRREYAALCRQIYNYGIGLTAFLTKVVLENPSRFFDLVVKIPVGVVFLISSRSPKNRNKSKDFPKDLTILERKGMFYGPLAYLQSVWKMRKKR